MEVVWSHNQISMLIEVYQHHSILWNPSSKDYKDKLKKNDAWADIAAKLNMSQREVETKMHILRSQFSREKKKVKLSKRTGSGAEGVIKSKWQWFEPLQFLLCGETMSGASDTVGAKVTSTKNDRLKSPKPTNINTQSKRTSTKRPIEDEAADRILCKSPKLTSLDKTDDAAVFGDFVAAAVRNMRSDVRRREMKRKIQRVILDMEELDESDHSPAPSSNTSRNLKYETLY